MGPTLGVLITYCDEKELLTQCIESLVEVPGPPVEILVHDDASRFPASAYVPRGIPVRITRSNLTRGPSYARNQLLEASTADYIHFQDADDLFNPDWSLRIHRAINEHHPDAIFTEVSTYRAHELVAERVLNLTQLAAGEDLVSFCLRGSLLTPSGTYRRSCVAAIGGYRTALWQSEDYDFHVRLAASGIRYAVIPDPMVRKQIRPESRSHNVTEVWSDSVRAIRLLAAELPPTYAQDLCDAAARSASQLFSAGDRAGARDAFGLARELGMPSFDHQRSAYKMVARPMSPVAAEWLALWYRTLVPRSIRAWSREVLRRRLAGASAKTSLDDH